MDRLSTGCGSIDSLLDGGFEKRTVSQIYGLPSTGKTNIALQTAVEVAKKGTDIVYIDTEGLSLERLEQIAGNKDKKIKNRFHIKNVLDFEEQSKALKKAEGIVSNSNLLILDSATGLYRAEKEVGEEREILSRLGRQIAFLSSLARKYDIAVIITNQVYTDIDDGGIDGENIYKPFGGTVMEHWCKTILRLEKSGKVDLSNTNEESRRAILEKHRSKPSGNSVFFKITSNGIEKIE